ncbi:hypothetical protein [Nocardia sp. 348MFTsu5.1]|uniref:hypothetical protein n=1 Tax=Nocardia sp. 348MFTsu5.1 TaxID=1172185 RepID=UPI00036F0946|nr:hypothetical protein [Nocardia sp. 348MFTsu5.1]
MTGDRVPTATAPPRIERWFAVVAVAYAAIAMWASTFFYVTAMSHDSTGSMKHRFAMAPGWTWQASVTAAAVVAAFVGVMLESAMTRTGR